MKIIGTKNAEDDSKCIICQNQIRKGERIAYLTDYTEYLHKTHRHCIIQQILQTFPELKLNKNKDSMETTLEAI